MKTNNTKAEQPNKSVRERYVHKSSGFIGTKEAETKHRMLLVNETAHDEYVIAGVRTKRYRRKWFWKFRLLKLTEQEESPHE